MIDTSEFRARRAKMASQMAANSVLIIPSAKEVTRSNDTEYAFRQNSYFWYFTGFSEPDACLIISQQDGQLDDILFCRESNKLAEIWQGRRMGVDDAPDNLGVQEAYAIDEFPDALLSILDGSDNLYFAMGEDAEVEDIVLSAVDALRSAPKQSKQAPLSIIDPRKLMDEMRLFKSTSEIAVMQRAANISVAAHKRAMRYCQPGTFEYQLEAEIHHEFAIQGARHPAYSTIVGAGDNACILHYTENKDAIGQNDLVLIDAGAEFNGYAADITRTFPACGKFTKAQKHIYDIVLAAQEAALASIKPGNCIKNSADIAIEVITNGLIELGILTGTVAENIEKQSHREFYMHGLGHWLGLDVHDVGDYKVAGVDREYQPGMVMTVEPGIYIAPDANVDKPWQGIGVRIEDNILVTSSGYTLLTKGLPRTSNEIEAFMA